MPISKGDRMPDGMFTQMGDNGPGLISTDELFTGKKVLLFSVGERLSEETLVAVLSVLSLVALSTV